MRRRPCPAGDRGVAPTTRCLALAVLMATLPPGAAAVPEAQLSPGAALGELPRFGVNLGGRTVWGAEQLMGNVLRNPGLEAALDGALIIAGRVSADSVDDDTPWTARPPGFWAGAGFEVLSGPAAGQRGRVVDSRRRAPGEPDRLWLTPMPAGLRAGDVLAVQGLQDTSPAPLWWTQGAVLPHPPRPGSPGQRALQLSATAGAPAALFHHLDSIGARAGKLLPVRGRWQLTLWVRAVDGPARLRMSFGRHGRPNWLDRRLDASPQWQHLSLAFDTQDDGPAGPLMLALSVEQGELAIDDVSLGALAPEAAGGFRSEVVQTLRALRPGYLREWQGQLADAAHNRLAPALARHPIRYRPGTSELQFAYALPEFLALAAEVGARPWVVLPATTTPAQARQLGRALAQGWQQHHFDEVVVEHGNEHWNAVFRPAGIADAGVLAEVADRAFAALREGAGPAMPLHRVVGTQYVNPAAAGRLARLSRHTEGVTVAPYFHYRQETADSTEAALDRALHEDLAPLLQTLEQLRPLGRALDVYEVNFHTTLGSARPSQRDAVVTAPAAGAALARRLMETAAAGVQRQAVYTLAGYDTFTAGPARELVQLFGITRDLSGPAHLRPTGQALAALNQVIGGTAQRGQCRGEPCAEISALAFDGGTRWAIVSAAAVPVRVRWACRGPMRLLGSAGALPEAPCTQGQASAELPPRSWLTARP